MHSLVGLSEDKKLLCLFLLHQTEAPTNPNKFYIGFVIDEHFRAGELIRYRFSPDAKETEAPESAKDALFLYMLENL